MSNFASGLLKIHPVLYSIIRLMYKLLQKFLLSIFYFVFFIPALVLKILRIDLLSINTSRIGHLVFDGESYIKDKKLQAGKYVKPLLLAPKTRVANIEFLKYFDP